MRRIPLIALIVSAALLLTAPLAAETPAKPDSSTKSDNSAKSDTTQPSPPSPAETTRTKVGQTAPDFTVATLTGDTFTLGDHRGQVVLVNWFATWCPPCKEEMPHLQQEVWEKFGPRGLVLISVARAENADVVAPFVKQRELGWTFGLDPERAAYAKYAEAYIPRNTLIGPEGKIIFQSEGFAAEDFAAMITAIENALAEQSARPNSEAARRELHGSVDEAGASHEGDHRRSAELAAQVSRQAVSRQAVSR